MDKEAEALVAEPLKTVGLILRKNSRGGGEGQGKSVEHS